MRNFFVFFGLSFWVTGYAFSASVTVKCLSNPAAYGYQQDIYGSVSLNNGDSRLLVGSEYSSGYHTFYNVGNGNNTITVRSHYLTWTKGWELRNKDSITVNTYNNDVTVTCSFDKKGKISGLRVTENVENTSDFISEYLDNGDANGLKTYARQKNIDLDEYINKRDSDGDTRLIREVNRSIVNPTRIQTLVELGARVNLRNEKGESAASIAYDKGEIEIYNYFKEHGAIDYEPKQAAAAPAASPSYSSGSSSSASSAGSDSSNSSSSAPARNYGKEVAESLQKAFESPIDNGTYKMSGRKEELHFASIGKSGFLTYKDADGKSSSGSYSIDGIRITMQILGRTFFYNVTSKTSFSGNGESWYRSGY